MQLRSTTRPPGRYREDDVPELPSRASFVHPTVPYNPNLPPAAFPTLDYPPPAVNQRAEVMTVPSRPDSPESGPEQKLSVKRATVFHGNQKSSSQWLKSRISSDAEVEEVEGSEPDTSTLQEWCLLDANLKELGEYDGWGVMANNYGDGESPRVDLRVYELAETWSRVTDGLKLIITMDLTAVYSFRDAIKKLMLTEEEENEVLDLFEREFTRQEEEEKKIAQSQDHQLQILMSKGPEISREAASASFEDLYTDVEDSPTFIIKKTDIACAQQFLRSVKLKEYADGLWRYEGVAQPLTAWNKFPTTNEPSSVIKSTFLEGGRYALRTLENAETGILSSEKKQNTSILEKVDTLPSNAKPVKRCRVERRPISSKLPSRLRNSVSGSDLEETVALGPPALQIAFSPHKRPAPPPLRHSVEEKKPVTPRFRFVKKPAVEPSTPPPKIYDLHEHTPDSPTLAKQTHNWLSEHVESYSPLPCKIGKTRSPLRTPSRVPKVNLSLSKKPSSPLTTPSSMPKVRLTVAQARLAQIDNILGRKADVVAKPFIPGKEHVNSIATAMGAPLEITLEKTGSASRNADVNPSPSNRSVTDDAQKAAAPIHKQGGKADELSGSITVVQSDNVVTAPSQKKRKFQGEEDSAYRALGQRRPKIQEQNESSTKGSAQKRRKIQDGERGTEPPSEDKETSGNDMAEKALKRAAASQLTTIQVMSVTAAKKSNSMTEWKGQVRNMVAGQNAQDGA